MSQQLSNEDLKIQRLFEAADSDPGLKRRLLSEPRATAGEWGIDLGDQEVERLAKLGAFVALANEAKVGPLFRACDPRIFYPATVWLREEVEDLIRHIVDTTIPVPGPIGYPADIKIRLRDQLDRTIGGRRRQTRG